MKAIVIGGTGATGTALIDHLLQDNEITEIVSLVRKPERKGISKIKEIKVNFDQLSSYTDVIKGDIAFSCLGTTLKAAGSKKAQWKVDYEYNLSFAQLAKNNQIPTFVLLSALNANTNGFFFYSKMKGKLEDAIKKLDFKHLVIARPSVLIRPHSDRTGEKMSVYIMKLFNRLGLFKKYQALPVDQVAKTLMVAGKKTNDKLVTIEVNEILQLSQ